MEGNKEEKIETQFNLICPESGVGNLKGAKNYLVCGKNLEEIVLFLEDYSFDLEITENTRI